jgi:hypothetical protein
LDDIVQKLKEEIKEGWRVKEYAVAVAGGVNYQ